MTIKILSFSKKSNSEAEIDKLVYELYGLSELEVRVVEGK
jgi:hypothetical protein